MKRFAIAASILLGLVSCMNTLAINSAVPHSNAHSKRSDTMIAVSDIPPVPDRYGTLIAKVSLFPARPVQRPGEQALMIPAANVAIRIESDDQQTIDSIKTDQHGKFTLKLPAGEYRLVFMSTGAGNNPPVNVKIEAGKEQHIRLQFDAGIR